MRSISLGFFAAAVLLVACEKKQQTQNTDTTGAATAAQGTQTATPAGDDSAIWIGEVGSLSGAQATFGESTHQGIMLAVEEANAQGGINGKKIQVKTYDSQGRPEEAANATTRLITQDGVKLILGEVASTNSIAMANKAQPAGVPMISPSSTNVKVTQIGDYIFRVCFIDPFQGYVMAKFAKDNLKINRVAVLKDNKSDYSEGLAEVFTRKFTEMGGKIVSSESYSQGDSDFRAQLTEIKQQKPEAIYVPGYYNDVGVIARQARQLGLKVPLLGGDGWDSEKLFELGGSAIDGSYYSNHYSVEDPSPRVQKFIADYKKAHGGKVPDGLAALGFDAARIAIEAMKRAKDLTGPSIRDAIARTRDFPGVTGMITLDANRNAVKPAVVLEIKDGSQKYVATVTP